MTDRNPAGQEKSDAMSVSLAELLGILIRRWRIWAAVTAVAAVGSVIVSLLLTPMFRSYVSFVPEVSNQAMGMGQLGGLLQQEAAGLGLGLTGSPGQSPSFYVDLLRSASVRSRVVEANYQDTSRGFSGSLVDFFRLDDTQPPARALQKSMEVLADRTSISQNTASGIVSVSVETRDPVISQQVAAQYQAQLESFNETRRSLRTRKEVQFLRAQLVGARHGLEATEDSLERFLDANRSYQQSPALQLQWDRLDRHVSIRSGIVSQLQQQFEQAQLELLAAVPTVSIIDSPRVPQQRSRPKRTLIVLTATLLGFILGAVSVFLVEGWERTYDRMDPEARAELVRLLQWVRRAVSRLRWRRRSRT